MSTSSGSGGAGGAGADSAVVWSIIGTLVAGPAVWGLIGFGIDRLVGTSIFLPIGVVVGFVGSLVIVYMRFGRG
jgi:ATP synthase protein I